jgi:hypothetical protein
MRDLRATPVAHAGVRAGAYRRSRVLPCFTFVLHSGHQRLIFAEKLSLNVQAIFAE